MVSSSGAAHEGSWLGPHCDSPAAVQWRQASKSHMNQAMASAQTAHRFDTEGYLPVFTHTYKQACLCAWFWEGALAEACKDCKAASLHTNKKREKERERERQRERERGVCVRICMYVFVYMYTYMCIFTFIYVHTYIHIYIYIRYVYMWSSATFRRYVAAGAILDRSGVCA